MNKNRIKVYRLVTNNEWQHLLREQKSIERNKIFRQELGLPRYGVIYDTLPRWFNDYKQVKLTYTSEVDEIVDYCVRHQDFCLNLYQTLEQLGLYYGRNTYNRDDIKFSAALKEALNSQKAILLEKSIEPDSGMLPPQTNFLKLPSDKIPRKLTPDEIKAQALAFYEHDEENWIEITVKEHPNQAFSLFHSASQQLLYQGKLDDKGYAYVALPPRVKLVDVVFDKQQQHRPWYQDMPLQIAGGIRDAAQSTLNLAWDISSWLPSSPLFLSGIYQAIISDKPINTPDNPVNIVEIPQPETVTGALTHGVTQFLIGFIPVYRSMKFIKPLQKMGTWGKGVIAGSITDFTVFAPHEERLSNLIESFPELQNPVTNYLQAKPDDSAAEGRFKNALEGLLLGAIAEPFIHSLRALKYARIKWMAVEVRTRVRYEVEIITIETKSGSKGGWNKILNNPKPNTIYNVDGNKVFYTDELGRIKQVDAELKLNNQDRNTYQQLKTGQEGIDGDEGGHLIASILDGSGEKINLMPMNANLNRGAWKQMENTWAKALQEGKTVKVKIEPIYNGSNIRPESLKIKYSIDGKTRYIDFENAYGGK